MATRLTFVVQREILRQEWPRANETHLAAEHVDELREFVETCRSQEATESVQAFGVRASTVGHGPELDQLERHTATTRSLLSEEDRRPEPDPHSNRDRRDQWREHDEHHKGYRNVDSALHNVTAKERTEITS